MNTVDKVSNLKMWEPIAYMGGIIAVAALAWTAFEINKAYQVSKKKDEVKKGLEEVKEVIIAETNQDFSGCGGCSGAAGENITIHPKKDGVAKNYDFVTSPISDPFINKDSIFSGVDGNFIRPNSVIMPTIGA